MEVHDFPKELAERSNDSAKLIVVLSLFWLLRNAENLIGRMDANDWSNRCACGRAMLGLLFAHHPFVLLDRSM
jgi:hypothetical protein